jgi:hypothetical protein
MNDPMEGFYRPSILLKGQPNYRRIVRQIADSKSGIGIACFTETHDDVLMWTHYADNYSGICLSYSAKTLLRGLPDDVNLVRLAYVDKPPLLATGHARAAREAAIRILSQKKYNWAYEREWRVLGPVGRVNISGICAVKAIYFGSRVKPDYVQQILLEIQGTTIKAYEMSINGYDHTWKLINKARRTRKSVR